MKHRKRKGDTRPLYQKLCSVLLSGILAAGVFPASLVSVAAATSTYEDEGIFGINIGLDMDEHGNVIKDNEGNEIDGSAIYVGDLFYNEEKDTDSAGAVDGWASLVDTPYWKNDTTHSGKLTPAEATDYNLYYDSADHTLHLKDLDFQVTTNSEGNAIYCNADLKIVLEGSSSSIVCSGGIALMANGNLDISGTGDLNVVTQNFGDAAPAALVGVNVSNTVTGGTVTLTGEGDCPGLVWNYDVPEEHEVTGDGAFGEGSLPPEEEEEYVGRETYTDGELHIGYSGCYLTAEEYAADDVCYGGSPEDMEGYAPLVWVHGSTLQEVIDKLSGKEPVTVYDGEGNVVSSSAIPASLKTDYIRINVSTSNYAANYLEEQYITSTGGFKGIFVEGGYDKQMTNHEATGDYYVEDIVYALTADGRDWLNTLSTSYSLDLNGTNLNDVDYISLYAGGIYVATERASVDADHPYAYDLGDYITGEGDLCEALWGENGYYNDGSVSDDDRNWDVYSIILGGVEGENEQHLNLPFTTLHINSDCDFKISGMYDSVATPNNPEGINVYFGFLPDTNYSVTFVVENENGSISEKSYTKADLQGGSLRGTITFQTAHAFGAGGVRVLMYQHITSGSVSGDYGSQAHMDDATLPDAKLLRSAEITDEQLEVLENGNAVDIDLSVDRMDMSAAGSQAIITDVENELNKNNYVCNDPFYLDLEMDASIRDASGQYLAFQDGSKQMPVTELEDPAKITVAIPEQLKTQDANREYAVVRRHVGADGQVQTELLPVEYDRTNSALSFQTDRFSTYAIVYRDVAASTSDGASGGQTGVTSTSPSTGDTLPIGWIAGLLTVSGMGILLLNKKRGIR